AKTSSKRVEYLGLLSRRSVSLRIESRVLVIPQQAHVRNVRPTLRAYGDVVQLPELRAIVDRADSKFGDRLRGRIEVSDRPATAAYIQCGDPVYRILNLRRHASRD